MLGFHTAWVTRSAFGRRQKWFRERLTDARRERGLTQVDLARKLRRPQSFVSKYERGERRLDVVEFLDVASALGIDAAALIAELERSAPA